MTDLDLTLVRSFTVLVEHGHFGRAATALHLTQSSLSRQILRLEQQVGARLVDRTPRGSSLTASGEVFLSYARELLGVATAATAHARTAARPDGITIGFVTGVAITAAVRELRRRFPSADVQTRHLTWGEPRAALLERRVDVAVARMPVPSSGLDLTVLYEEPRVLVAPRDHRLAGQESVTVDDIAGEPLPRADDPVLDAYWRIDPRPDGSPAPDGPLVTAAEDKVELIAAGRMLAILPASMPITALRPDLTTIPLAGVEPSQVVLATRAGERGELAAAFAQCWVVS